jgi:hypothetical protein
MPTVISSDKKKEEQPQIRQDKDNPSATTRAESILETLSIDLSNRPHTSRTAQCKISIGTEGKLPTMGSYLSRSEEKERYRIFVSSLFKWVYMEEQEGNERTTSV